MIEELKKLIDQKLSMLYIVQKEMLTREEAAIYMGVSDRYLTNLIKEEHPFPVNYISTNVCYIKRTDIDDFIKHSAAVKSNAQVLADARRRCRQ